MAHVSFHSLPSEAWASAGDLSAWVSIRFANGDTLALHLPRGAMAEAERIAAALNAPAAAKTEAA
jgi:hypothetical protein